MIRSVVIVAAFASLLLIGRTILEASDSDEPKSAARSSPVAADSKAATGADPSAAELDAQLPRIPAQEPEEAQAGFTLLDGFRLDLLAAEPLVTDPVAMAYDENGRLFVVEMRGYPYPEGKDEHPLGKVRILEDENDDGVFDTSFSLVEGLSWPTGIACWKGGVFVTAAPDIWYFKDTDGDNHADVRKRVYTGFGKYNVQALVNGLQWGPDHYIYGATAANGGSVRPADDPKATPVDVRGRDFRFDPSTGAFEAISGTAQFGSCFDDWYNRYVCSNSDHAQQMTLPSRYLARNPYLAVPSVRVSIAKGGGAAPVFRASSAEPWRVVRTRRRATSGKKYRASELVPIGFFTSATGITVYRGAAYPNKYRGNLFIGDVGGNLIHRKRLAPNGAIMSATRADENVEFATSTDNWFRPVNFVNAPDGTLHVADMYRETIEHPWSIPEDIKSFLDLESGRDRGRIYRLTPSKFDVPPAPDLGSASIAELVRRLEDPNSWWRETAHRLLWERQDESAIEPLRSLLSRSKLPQARLHALYSLDGLNALEAQDVLAGLNDASAPVRRHAVRLAEPLLDDSDPVFARVLELANDADPPTRMQVAFGLGEATRPEVMAGLGRIARRDGADRWIRTAVLSSSVNVATDLLVDLLADPKFSKLPAGQTMLEQLASVVGARNREEEVRRVLASLAARDDQRATRRIVTGLGDGLSRSRSGLGRYLTDSSSPAARLVAKLVSQALGTANDPKSNVAQRAEAVRILGHGDFRQVGGALADLLDAREPKELQLAAVHALSGFDDPTVAEKLIEPWRQYTPEVRGEVLEALVSRKERVSVLLDAIADGAVAVGQIGPARKRLLTRHRDPTLRSRAASLLGPSTTGSRKEVVAAYRPALSRTGDAGRGKKAFERECRTCHKVAGQGHEVGPNLATIRNRTPEALMTQILDPNVEMLPNYTEYVVSLDDGRLVTGLIAAETPTSITIKRAEGATDVILRQNIDEMSGTGKSLMPEGFENKIDPSEMADLVAFLLQLN